ncbi:thiol reductant ABC exporter subunit CydD [Raoultibacter phocaeensis]|uniref:thiol reductant ABC exporter subunit CydD n=1 Tax=Raoultibacter phocaeensis TaxID=2479841 RepID=UPI00111B90E7|nr:thiol reductant ABC exporter subunit CydD [Raoultibacter phocaeensis]
MIDKAVFELPGIKRVLAALCGFAAAQALCIIGQALSLSTAITNLWYGGALADQLVWIAAFFLCFVGKQGIVYMQEGFINRYAYERADALRSDLLHTIFATKAQVVRQNGTGSVSAAVLEGIDQVETYFRLILPKMTALIVIPVLLLIVVFPLDWVSGFIMLIAFPFIILYMAILGRTAKEKASAQHRTFQIMSNHFIDTLRGIDTLKLFGASKGYGETIYEVSERFRVASMKTIGVATVSSFVLDLFSTLSIAAVAFMLGMRLLDGTLVLFPALAVLVLAPEYFKPIKNFASDYHASLDGKNALSSIQALVKPTDDLPVEQPIPEWTESSRLALRTINFSYPDHMALSGISLEAQGFAKYGIVGASGAGKSTLVSLLGGFCTPESGSITIDGVDASGFDQADWQKQVIYIPQDPYIFHATLRDNIAFYHPQASAAAIANAVEIVGLDELIDELPEGLDTLIGEGARPLSGGQAQRIALARAFLDDSRKILLFDEPTAHLDIETEMELKERMLPLMEGRLVFFATHRLHWMQDMDEIIVMEDGRIAGRGDAQAVMADSAAFAALASLTDWTQA